MRFPRASAFRIACVAVFSAALVALAGVPGCGGGGGDGGSPGKGAVALYMTDSLSVYQQVTATLTKVQLLHADRSSRCDLLSEPVTVNIANLSEEIQLLDRTSCPAGNYTRLYIQVEAPVQLVDQSGTASACRFVSYFDDNDAPSALSCDPATDLCGLDIRGAVRSASLTVAPDVTNIAGLDFDLKKFEVDGFGGPSCAVTLKVTPVHGGSLQQLMRNEGITGMVSDLDTGAGTFLLTRRSLRFTVDLAGINSVLQPGLDLLLQQAQTEGLPTRVISRSFDLAAGTIKAKTVAVKAAGTVSDLNTSERTFTLTTAEGVVLDISYAPPGRVSGSLADGAWVVVTLKGFCTDTGNDIASRVEVMESGTMTED